MQSLADGVYVVVSGPTIVVAELGADVALVDVAKVDILSCYRRANANYHVNTSLVILRFLMMEEMRLS
jgi:hypothetical protein